MLGVKGLSEDLNGNNDSASKEKDYFKVPMRCWIYIYALWRIQNQGGTAQRNSTSF